MRIAHFNSFLNGGAAIAARRIHEGLKHFRRTIVSSHLFHQSGETEQNAIMPAGTAWNSAEADLQPIPFKADRLNRFRNPWAYRRNKQRRYRIFDQYNAHLAGRLPELESFSMAELPGATRLDWPSVSADVVHLHWVSHLIDYPSFFDSVPRDIPIVWTLHDMNPFTGGCHYADQCLQYRFGCGNCPQVVRPRVNDVSRSTLQAKKEALQGRNVTVVAPSVWMADQARLSPVWPDNTQFQVIHYGIDLSQFAPMSKQHAREEFGIDPHVVLVGFGAADVQSSRKGMQHLIRALQIIERENRWGHSSKVRIETVVFGGGKLPDVAGLPPMHQLGFADSPEKLRRIYSAVDLVVVPSRADNQPQVGLEAMACGRPVIGFASGGIPEYVRHETNGLVVSLGDEIELANSILRLARDSNLRSQFGNAARQMMESEFEIVQQSERYIALYQSVISAPNHKAQSKAA